MTGPKTRRNTSDVVAMLLVGAASAALFYLMREHWRHVFGILPYLLFLACPLLHFFMHGKHDHSDQHRDYSLPHKPKDNMA
jgi:hypothetical protein